MKISWRTSAVIVGTAVAFVACSVDPSVLGDAMIEGGELLRDATLSDAAAQADPCGRWEVAMWRAPVGCLGTDMAACAAPDGWEPVALYGPGNDLVFLRRCVAP